MKIKQEQTRYRQMTGDNMQPDRIAKRDAETIGEIAKHLADRGYYQDLNNLKEQAAFLMAKNQEGEKFLAKQDDVFSSLNMPGEE